jgi:hypothetical protein
MMEGQTAGLRSSAVRSKTDVQCAAKSKFMPQKSLKKAKALTKKRDYKLQNPSRKLQQTADSKHEFSAYIVF